MSKIIFIFCLLISTSVIAQPIKGNDKVKITAVKKQVNIAKPNKKVTVFYQIPTDTMHEIWYSTFKESKTLEVYAKMLEDAFVIKKNLKISLVECGEVNAFYNSENKELLICYELFADLMTKMSTYISDPDSLGDKIGKVSSFIIFHEIGHAMIDVLDIPLTGKEEDAADYFAFFMLGSDGDDFGVEVCKEGALFFKELSDEQKVDTTFQQLNDKGVIYDALPFWDEHSFHLQRYYSINSLIFGSNPEKWDGLINIGYRRPGNAVLEYNKINRGWSRVLLPHFRKKKTIK